MSDKPIMGHVSFGPGMGDHKGDGIAASNRRLRADLAAARADADRYRMCLEIVWDAIKPTMMEEQLSNFLASYVRTALDYPESTVVKETWNNLIKDLATSPVKP